MAHGIAVVFERAAAAPACTVLVEAKTNEAPEQAPNC
jgi:hypothetical protein